MKAISPEEGFLNLIKIGEISKEVQEAFNSNENFWPDIYYQAKKQGVAAMAWEKVSRLPTEYQPHRALRIGWALQAEQMQQRYAQQKKVAAELASLFAEHGIRMLLLKGIGLSCDFPTPAHRECGDIDIWLFGDFDKGNKILLDIGAQLIAEVPKHTEFVWQGVQIENHRTLLNVRRNRSEREIDKLLCEILDREGVHPAPEGFFIPSPTFNAIYLIRHAAMHFIKEGIAVRHLCDWGYFMEQHHQEVDHALFEATMRRYGMTRFTHLMSSSAQCLLGADIQQTTIEQQLTDRFIGEILAWRSNAPTTHTARIWAKIAAPWRNRWRMDLLEISLPRYYYDTLRAQWNEQFTLLK